MIVVMAAYPYVANEGMNVRVASIDKCFQSYSRTYFKLEPRRIRIQKRWISSNCVEYIINPVLHMPLLLLTVLKSRLVYVHSVFNAFWILPLYFLHQHILTDLHGIVPEELRLNGKALSASVFSLVERVAYRRSNCLICVTEAMGRYLRGKYGPTASTFLTIPNTAELELHDLLRLRNISGTKRKNVVYVGGTQSWQNIPEILRAIKVCPLKLNYVFATRDLFEMQKQCEQLNLTDRIHLMTLDKDDLWRLYETASLGFIIRDKDAINEVACPTKVIEYLASGVVPIVMQPSIGDFCSLGYEYVLLKDFEAGKLPTESDLVRMRSTNYGIIQQLFELAEREFNTLVRYASPYDSASAVIPQPKQQPDQLN